MMRGTSFTAAAARRFILLGLLPVAILGIVTSIQLRSVLNDSARYQQSFVAGQVRAEIESFISGPKNTLTQLAHLDPNGIAPVDSPNLVAAIEHLPYVESVVLVDLSGTVLAGATNQLAGMRTSEMIGIDKSSDPVFTQATKTQEVEWSSVFTSPVSGNRVIELAAPTHQGIAMATIGVEALIKPVTDVAGDPDIRVIVLSKSGAVLFHSDKSIAKTLPNLHNLPPVTAAAAGKYGAFKYRANNRALQGTTAPLDDPGWIVLAEQDVSDASRPLMRALSLVGMTALLVSLVALLSAYIFSSALGKPIVQLADFADHVARGEYDAQVGHYRHREFKSLADRVSRMAQALERREANLEHRGQELLALNTQLTEALANEETAKMRVSAMSAQLTMTEERERRHLAEALHDRVSQVLAVARMHVAMARDDDCDGGDLSVADQMIGEALQQARSITSELAETMSYELGIGSAIQAISVRFQQQFDLNVDVTEDIEHIDVTDEITAAVLRTVSELLMNTVKHSGSKEARVTLTGRDGSITLVVCDEGSGFTPQPTQATREGGFGLLSIQERAIHLGGSLEIDSAPGKGTRATLRFPGDQSGEGS